jgi:hypothetical protein
MAAPPKYRKRNPGHPANKNELKVSRRQNEEQERSRAATLQDLFPRVVQVQLDLRMETPTGAILEQSTRRLAPGEPLLLDTACLGGCRDGLFPLQNAVANVLQAEKESHEGMGICQASSYQDPKLPCSTKLIYHIKALYK